MPFNENRLKVQLKLAINRLKMLQSKKQSINQQQRRELATLMENGKVESARIRVEHVIREDYHMEAMEVLELLCELLLARSALLATSSANPSSSSSPMDPTLMEAVQTIIFAATRCEGAKELMQVRDQLVSKFGREFGELAHHNRMGLVNTRVFQRLQVLVPPVELVNSYLREIAAAYNVPFNNGNAGVTNPMNGNDNNGDGTATRPDHVQPTLPPGTQVVLVNNRPYQLVPVDAVISDNAGQQQQQQQQKAPAGHIEMAAPIIPPLPGSTAATSLPVVFASIPDPMDLPSAVATDPAANGSPVLSPPPPDFDALAKRFEELKRKK